MKIQNQQWLFALLLSALLMLAGCALQMPPAADLVPPTLTPITSTSDEATTTDVTSPAAEPVVEAVTEPAVQAEVSNITPEQQAILDQLQNYGPPPELTNEIWLNSEPLQLADLRGNVVIVEFWTYG